VGGVRRGNLDENISSIAITAMHLQAIDGSVVWVN
jgi:hypothetical protein